MTVDAASLEGTRHGRDHDPPAARPRRYASIRRIVARHPVAAVLTMMFVVDIMVSLSPVLTRRDVLPFGQAPYDWLVHILGSAVPAFLVTGALHGSEGVRDLAARCLRWRFRCAG